MNKRLLQVIKMKYGVHKQSDVARASEMTRAEVSLIWSGKRNLTVESLVKLCKGAGVEVWEVWKESGE